MDLLDIFYVRRKRTKTGPLAGGEDPAFDDDSYANEYAYDHESH